MRFPATMMTTVVATCFAIPGLAAVTADGPARQPITQAEAASAASTTSDTVVGPNNETAVAVARSIQHYMTNAICLYSPDFCDKHQLQSRGIQSYLATAGTLFAGVLGVILTKIKILVVLSLMTTVIGKMLLFYAFLKAHDPYHHHHVHKPHHHAPFVKYTRDKYYIKHTPSEHSHDVIVEPDSHHHAAYHGGHHHQPSGGVSYYRR